MIRLVTTKYTYPFANTISLLNKMSNSSGSASNGSDQNLEEPPLSRTYGDAKKESFMSKRPEPNQTVTASDATQVGPHAYVIGEVPESMKPANQDASASGNATAATNGVNGHQSK
jgi:hypothetical protein